MIPRKISIRKFVDSPDTLNCHSGSQPSASKAASHPTTWSNNCRPTKKVSTTVSSKNTWFSSAITNSGR